jgi:hypothetical protein
MMYEGREDRRGDDRRSSPRGDRPFGRRIDCAENGSARSATPARGGGQRDPEAFAARTRDDRA